MELKFTELLKYGTFTIWQGDQETGGEGTDTLVSFELDPLDLKRYPENIEIIEKYAYIGLTKEILFLIQKHWIIESVHMVDSDDWGQSTMNFELIEKPPIEENLLLGYR